MKVAILAGGLGTRMGEETELRPKPMVEVGGQPLLWHIMKHYASHHFHEFVIALGYRGDAIKRYMIDYMNLGGNLAVQPGGGAVERLGSLPNWRVQLIETGADTLTGGRIKRLSPYIGEETFCLTWGDGLSDIDFSKLVAFHRSHGKLATVTAVRPPARFGHMKFEGNRVVSFNEKSQLDEGWINGAFFVLEPGVMDYIDGDLTMWEAEPMRQLAADGQLIAYTHPGFWACMDTQRDKQHLEELWQSGTAPWKTWSE